jgi:hypothetical protein
MYRHTWGDPYYVRLSRSGRYRAYQDCRACGTKRNPVNSAIVRRGTNRCWEAEVEVDPEQMARERDRFIRQLRFLELAGEAVEWDHGSKKETAREAPTFL